MNKGGKYLPSSLLWLVVHKGAGNKGTGYVGAGGLTAGLTGRLKTMRNLAKQLCGEQTQQGEDTPERKSQDASWIQEMGKEASQVRGREEPDRKLGPGGAGRAGPSRPL